MGVEEAIKAYIFCGGEFFADGTEPLSPCDISIAADSGIYAALEMGVLPDLFIGDFDSFDKKRLSAEALAAVEKIKTVTYPAKKDLTDSMIAVETALEKGADEIVIYGALGGRLDHTLSNVFFLKHIRHKNVRAVIENGRNTVRYIEDEAIELKKRRKYVSLLAVDGRATGVCIGGVEYPLNDAVLEADYPYAVSNRIIGEKCRISVENGGLLVVESDE